MAEQRTQRRLAAILAADVVGYKREFQRHVLVVYGKHERTPFGRAEFAFSEARFKLHTSAAMQSSSIEMIRS